MKPTPESALSGLWDLEGDLTAVFDSNYKCSFVYFRKTIYFIVFYNLRNVFMMFINRTFYRY